jgi:hypothetical protein
MEAASAAIPPLGLVLDLILRKVLTCMRKRSTTWSAGASVWLARVEGWMGVGAGARRSQDRYSAAESDNSGSNSDGRKMKENGVNPASGRPIYRAVHRIYSLRFLPPYNTPQRLYPEKFARRSRRIFANKLQLQSKSEFRSSAKQEDNIRSS